MTNKIIYALEKEEKKKKKVKNKNIYVKEINQKDDFHTEYGIVYKEEFDKLGLTETHNGSKISILNASFRDDFAHLKRGAQLITLKDASVILAETGITSESVIIDAGSGSGGLACFLAKYSKQVYSFDNRKEHLICCNKNKDFLKLENVEFNICDIRNLEEVKNITKQKADVFTLDIPDPTTALESVNKLLKIGGYFVCYSPQVTQAKSVVNQLEEQDNFKILKVKEILHREWDLSHRKSKPLNLEIGHTGFLVFARKLQ